jgi:signal transduction histidine kinase
MDTVNSGQNGTSEEIPFANRNRARSVTPSLDDAASDILRALNIEQPKAVIMLSGAAGSLDEEHIPRLTQLLSRGVAKAAANINAAIIDGGTQAGVMELMGQGVADRGHKTPLIGVAPKGLVTYPGGPELSQDKDNAPLDPNHSHFVLVDSDEWGGESEIMYQLGAQLARGPAPAKQQQANGAPTEQGGADQTGQTPAAPEEPGVKVPGESGQQTADETKATDRGDQKIVERPVVVVLAGGRPQGIVKREVLLAVRNNWPVIVIEGSGEFPDTLSTLCKAQQRPPTESGNAAAGAQPQGSKARTMGTAKIDDPALAEIIHDGTLIFFPKQADAAELQHLIELNGRNPDKVLELAWRRFAFYDRNAGLHQTEYNNLTVRILLLGFLTTLLALVIAALEAGDTLADVMILNTVLRYLLIALPIVTSIFVTIFSRRKADKKWILLRASAEALKRKIYSYRALVRQAPIEQLTQLQHEVENVSRRLMRTEVNESALIRYEDGEPVPPEMHGAAGEDDGFSPLTPEQYIKIRIGDQVSFFGGKTKKLEQLLRRYRVLVLIAGGLGTFLAAVGHELWVPLTTAAVTALTSLLLSRQYDETIIKYNQAKTDLLNVELWWQTLAPAAKQNPKSIRKLVETTEDILAREQSGWVQNMQDALSQLRQEFTEEEQQDSTG